MVGRSFIPKVEEEGLHKRKRQLMVRVISFYYVQGSNCYKKDEIMCNTTRLAFDNTILFLQKGLKQLNLVEMVAWKV